MVNPGLRGTWLRLAAGLVLMTMACSLCAAEDSAALDKFGITKLFPTKRGGREYFAHWTGTARTFTGQDPDDLWYDADHGNGTYTVDGAGHLTAAGSTVRMYVHDPKKQAEWDENLEITVYVTRISETQTVSYSGLQIFARTNHGTLGNENENLCDDRGYGAKLNIDGTWAFEKETKHEGGHGYVTVAATKPAESLPKNVKVGLKYVLRNMSQNTQVKVELYRDLSDGTNGGKWEKITEFVDTGSNWGVGADTPKAGVLPQLPLIKAQVLPSSESKKPMLTVYFRHEYGTMRYERLSIREVEPLP